MLFRPVALQESELEYTRKELAEKASECAELRVSLSRKSEEAAAAQVEVRVLHEEIQSTREEAAHLSQQLAGAEEEVARIRHEASNMALQDASRLREELEQAHSEVSFFPATSLPVNHGKRRADMLLSQPRRFCRSRSSSTAGPGRSASSTTCLRPGKP